MHKQIIHRRNIILNENNIYLTNWIFFVYMFALNDDENKALSGVKSSIPACRSLIRRSSNMTLEMGEQSIAVIR